MIAQELEVSLHMAFVEARQKRHEFTFVKKWCVDHDVVEVLAAHIGMVHDQHVAGLETVPAMGAHAIDDRGPQIGEKNRQRAEVLRKNIAVRIDDANAVIAHLVDHHIVGSLAQDGGHFISDMSQAIAHDLNRDRIDGGIGHFSLR